MIIVMGIGAIGMTSLAMWICRDWNRKLSDRQLFMEQTLHQPKSQAIHPRRVRIVYIDCDLILAVLNWHQQKAGYTLALPDGSNMPGDAVAISVGNCAERGCMCVVFSHPSFDMIQPGQPYPIHDQYIAQWHLIKKPWDDHEQIGRIAKFLYRPDIKVGIGAGPNEIVVHNEHWKFEGRGVNVVTAARRAMQSEQLIGANAVRMRKG